ncbi:hypothetical protein ACQKOK_22065 [Bacillus cereus]|uniref:hypothetical protein n=1 Tax=Bacillus cereus TaxID=1396 RepID=UPI003D06F0E8
MKFNFERFVEEVHKAYSDTFTLREVNELLNTVYEYKKDTPISTGKKLILTKININGIKSSGEEINFRLPLNTGVNIIVGDNLKGKSSLFKMIQLALTGSNKLKYDVKKWIKSILLSFKINDKQYSIIIKFENNRMKGALYSGVIDNIDDRKISKLDPIFETSTINEYEEQIQDFFFMQFSYYSLKWTQKSSSKEKNELVEANASWKTYFKSIYLESKDSASLMYGSQGKKVFQMLLGLELTLVINQLSVKKDFLQFNNAKQIDQTQGQKNQDKKDYLLQRKVDLENELVELNSFKMDSINQLHEKYEIIVNEINDENALITKNAIELSEERKLISEINWELDTYTNELKRIKKEINKNDRSINDMKEYIEIGIFFSNLNIKQCPSCNHEVKKENIHQEKKCILCHEPVHALDKEINQDIYYQKLADLEIIKKKLNEEKSLIEKKIIKFNREFEQKSLIIKQLEDPVKNREKISSLKKKLKDIEESINKEMEKLSPKNERKTVLVAEKAVIDYRLDKLTQSPDSLYKEEKKIELLEKAIRKLNKLRYDNGQKIFKYLSDLMLENLHHFGLNSITEIKINENFDIKYKQNGYDLTFDSIAEGEQLRAKIALYLALIQLDIEYNFGRHTRFLIIDSPNKEEGDSNYLTGLTEVLVDIDKRYGDNLQIIIGTAERKLAHIVQNEKVFNKGEYVF